MHPAYSVIFFTTASGAGYGLLALLGLFHATGLLPSDRWFGLTGLIVSLCLITFGLLSSTLHLGHPERAWRAFSQWRSSWLSREGVLAVATYLPALLFGYGWVVMEVNQGVWALLALLTAFGAAATVFCTAMIYRSLAAIPQWHQPVLPAVYLMIALSTGAIWLNALMSLFFERHLGFAVFFVATTVLAWRVKQQYWHAIDIAEPKSSVESATGLGSLGTVRLLEQPHTEANYLQNEMGFQIARKHAQKLRRISAALAFGLPIILILLQELLAPNWSAVVLAVVAALSASVGVVVERWLFFAEAKHKVMLYYGARAV